MKNIIIILILTASAFCWDETTSKYDYNTNSKYTTTKHDDGTTEVKAYNYTTGSQWQAKTDNDGITRGRDSDNNSWKYNSNTGSYINYGTGKICTGKGYGRVCTE